MIYKTHKISFGKSMYRSVRRCCRSALKSSFYAFASLYSYTVTWARSKPAVSDESTFFIIVFIVGRAICTEQQLFGDKKKKKKNRFSFACFVFFSSEREIVVNRLDTIHFERRISCLWLLLCMFMHCICLLSQTSIL